MKNKKRRKKKNGVSEKASVQVLWFGWYSHVSSFFLISTVN